MKPESTAKGPILTHPFSYFVQSLQCFQPTQMLNLVKISRKDVKNITWDKTIYLR